MGSVFKLLLLLCYMTNVTVADLASDIIHDHLDGFTWHLVFGIEWSYSLAALVDDYGIPLDVFGVSSTGAFIDWDSTDKVFSMTDNIDTLDDNGAWPGVYSTDLTVKDSRGNTEEYTFYYDIVSKEDEKMKSVIQYEEQLVADALQKLEDERL